MSITSTEPRRAGRVYTCLIGELIRTDEKPAAAAAAVQERVAAQNPSGTNVHSNRAIGAWLGVSEGTVGKHRNGICACFRDQA